MRRRRALAGLVVATMVGGLAFVQLAQASDQISCADVPPQTGGWRHAAGHAANGGGIADAAHPHYTGPGEESFDIGPVYKNCFEYIFRVLQKQSPNWLQGLAWFEPVVADTGQQLLPSTHTRVIASTELTGGDSFWDNVSSYNLESYVAVSGADHDNKIPGTDGVVRFSRNPEQFGRIDENQSKGRRQPIQYERAKLRPGVNAVCVKHYFLSTRNNKINSQSTIGTYCSEVTLTSNPPIVGYDNVVTVAGRLGTPGGTVASPQLGFGPGDEIFLNIRARNQGGDPSPAVTLTAYRPTSPPTSPGTPYQSFNHPDIPPGGDRNNDYSYIIPAGTPAGTVLCFGGEVSPASDKVTADVYDPNANGGQGPCYKLEGPSRYPYLTTSIGDIHAGGGIGYGVTCPTAAGSSGVTGRAGGGIGSSARYVASSGGNINQFGSDNDPLGANLSFGNDSPTGGYGSVCRPNLEAAAEAYIDRHPGRVKTFNPIIEPTFFSLRLGGPVCGSPLLSDITDPLHYCIHNGDIVVVNGPLSFPGTLAPLALTVPRRFTLYARGSVSITKNIQYSSGAYTRDKLPSFGLIATGNIAVTPNVTQLDGFYFAGGSLDTCRNASGVGPIITNPGQADACSAVLTANGFLMAQQFKFRRTGPAGAPGLQLSESINLRPGLYLATPPAFSDVITAKPRPDGERGPLY